MDRVKRFDAPVRQARSPAVAAPLMSLALLIGGCGGSEPSPDPAEEAVTAEMAQPSGGRGLAGAELGAVAFGAACAGTTAADFDRALALLHHMQYEEARAAFGSIAEADPACGMAHWGVAMTRFQPLWPSRPDAEAIRQGQAELKAAREAGLGSARDERLVRSAEAFYEGADTEWWTRIARWNAALEEAHAAHPDDTETTALYALSQLAAGQVADDRMAVNERAARTLLSIYERNPTHPGAIHYTIHANDVDSRADESLDVVRSYSDIAPDVPHALHMPTHIFVRLGSWPDVIEWNRRSADAALQHPAGDRLSHHYPHAIDYMVYARLQRGEDDMAAELVSRLTTQTRPFQNTFISAFHLAAAPARYAVERRAWEEAAALEPRTPADLPWDQSWWAEAMTWFARGLGSVHTGDPGAAERAEARMTELRHAARSAGEATMADYIEIDRLVLAAFRAQAAGDGAAALERARAAASLEAGTQKHPVTPGALYPAQEALGDLLMAQDQPARALEAYEGSLALWPGRLNSVLGAIRAARAAGMEDRAAAFEQERDLLTGGATVDRSVATAAGE